MGSHAVDRGRGVVTRLGVVPLLAVAVLVPVIAAPAGAQEAVEPGSVRDVVELGPDRDIEPAPPIADERGPIDERFGLGVPGLDDQLTPLPSVELAVPPLERGGESDEERRARPEQGRFTDEDLDEISHEVPPQEREPVVPWQPGESVSDLVPGRGQDAPPGQAVRVEAGEGWRGASAAQVRVLDPAEVVRSLPIGLGFEVRAEPGREAGRLRAGQAVAVELDVSSLADAPGNLLERVTVVRGLGCDLDTGSCARFEEVPGAEVDLSEQVVRFELDGEQLAADAAARVDVPRGELGSLGAAVDLPAFAAQSSGGSYYGLGSGVAGPGSDYSRAQLASLGSYQVGTQTGHAEYSYPLELTPAQWGATPQLGLSYSSGVIDGRVNGENNQAGPLGMGWSLTGLGSIVRHTEPCSSSGEACPIDGDLTDHFSLQMGGISGELVPTGASSPNRTVDGVVFSSEDYRIENDPSVRVRRFFANNARPSQAIAIASAGETGYWELSSDRSVYAYGGANFYGTQGGVLNGALIDIEGMYDGNGYWLLGSDGGVFGFGSAPFHGSAGGLSLAAPIVAMDARRDNAGYVLLGEDGGIFPYGTFNFFGSATAQVTTGDPAVDIAVHPSGWGYYVLTRSGKVIAIGDPNDNTQRVRHRGDLTTISAVTRDAVAIERSPSGTGYVIFTEDGGAYAFNTDFEGSGSNWFDEGAVVDAAISHTTSTSIGYWIQAPHRLYSTTFANALPSTNPDRQMTWWEVTTGDGTVMTFGLGVADYTRYNSYSIETVPMPNSGLTGLSCAGSTHCDVAVARTPSTLPGPTTSPSAAARRTIPWLRCPLQPRRVPSIR